MTSERLIETERCADHNGGISRLRATDLIAEVRRLQGELGRRDREAADLRCDLDILRADVNAMAGGGADAVAELGETD